MFVSTTPPIVSDRAARSGEYLNIDGLKIRKIIEGRENASDKENQYIELKYYDIDNTYYFREYDGITSRLYQQELTKYGILRSSSIGPITATYMGCIKKSGKPKRKSRRKSQKSKQTRRK